MRPAAMRRVKRSWSVVWVVAALSLIGCFDEVNEAIRERPRQQGEACSASAPCESTLVCGAIAGGSVCRLPAAGEPCPGGSSEGCGAGLVCSQFTCIARHSKDKGDACSYNIDCRTSLVCNWASYECQPPALLGEPCGHPNDCAKGLSCDDAQDVCAPSCEAPADCEDGSWCDRPLFSSEPGLCRPQVDAGEPCSLQLTGDTMCKGPLSCVVRCVSSTKTLDGICENFVPEGGACVACPVPDKDGDKEVLGALYSDAGCEPGLVCEGGACVKPTPSP